MIRTVTWVGNGSQQFVPCGFRPLWVGVKGGANAALMRLPDQWVQRSVPLAAAASVIGGIRLDPGHDGFWVGSHASVNTLGTTYHALVLADSDSARMCDMSWMGNGLAGHVVPLSDAALTPAAAIIKRDGTNAAVWHSDTSLFMADGAAVAGGVSAFGGGTVTVGTHAAVNELTPPDSGEGIDGIFFQSGGAVHVGSWTGDGATGRAIVLPIAPKAVIVQPEGAAARLATDTMAGQSGPIGATAMQPDEIALSAAGFTLPSAALNANATVYRYVAFADHDDVQPETAAPATVGRGAVHLYSREVASHIDCGQDNSLKFAADNLPHSIEWLGALEWFDPDRNDYGALIVRGGTSQAVGDVANSHQCGILALAPDDNALNWAGPQVGVVVADRYVRTGDVRKTWRTGILIPYGEFHHWCVTHDGSGKWELYRDGRLVKHRNIDMRTTALALANAKALTTRAMVIGATDSSGTKVGSQRMTFLSARLYSIELTRAQVLARYQREALGMVSVADVTTGLIEEWSAENAHGGVLPATVASANNGTITGGVVLRL